jgi:sortase A
VERLLVVAGSAMLVWYALAVADVHLAQMAARRSLEAVSSPVAPASAPEPERVPDAPAVPPVTSLPGTGDPIAEIVVPRVQMSAIVLHGSDARTLRRGPGHLEQTALPGEPGNVVIAGHRDSFFRPLRDVVVGDDIFLRTPHARFQYRVTSTRVVKPRDMSVVEPTADATLTLVTCFPFWVLGNAPDRYIVRAVLVRDPAGEPHATAPLIVTQAVAPQPPIAAPAAPQPAVETPRGPEPPAMDDDSLVRAAIERFRMAHNAHLFRVHEGRPGALLRFDTCDVAIADARAEATCLAATPVEEGSEPVVWSAALERSGAGWRITSIYAR